MDAKVSGSVIYVEATIYLLLYNLHDCTFKRNVFCHLKIVNLIIFNVILICLLCRLEVSGTVSFTADIVLTRHFNKCTV